MIKTFLLSLLLAFSGVVFANNKNIDSLHVLLLSTDGTIEKIALECKLSESYSEIGEFELGGEYANEALITATAINDEKSIAKCYYSLSRLNQYIGDFNKALSFHYLAIPLFEKVKAHENLAWTYLNMGICYYSQKNYKPAIKIEKKALDLFNRINHHQGQAYTYLNLSLSTNDLGKQDSALALMAMAKQICTDIKDEKGLGYVYKSIAEIYEEQGEYDKAIAEILACIKIREKENDKMDLSFCYASIGNIYLKKNDPTQAEKNLLNAEKLALEIDSRITLRTVYLSLSQIDSIRGNYKEAYLNFKRYSYFNGLLSGEENQRKAAELQYTYDKQKIKKEQGIQVEIHNTEQRNLILGLLLLGIGMVVVIAFSISMRKRANQMKKQRNIISTQKERADEAHKSIKDSIIYARKIQQALLTSEEYIGNHLKKDFFIYYQPKDIVSGDFYWASEHNNDFYLTTADCTGHGVPGAFMSLLNISIMNELIVERDVSSPAEVLNQQRSQIIRSLNSQGGEDAADGMDCILCKFNADKSEVTFAAANNSMWLIRDNKIEIFKGDKMPVGKFIDATKRFTEQTIALQKGDILYTFTDGITDQFGGVEDKKFKSRRLKELLLKIQELPMDEQNLIIMTSMEQWIGDREQTDDMLMIGVKV